MMYVSPNYITSLTGEYISKKRIKSITKSERAERARVTGYIHNSHDDPP
jgi:hypothetical protein